MHLVVSDCNVAYRETWTLKSRSTSSSYCLFTQAPSVQVFARIRHVGAAKDARCPRDNGEGLSVRWLPRLT